MNVNELKSLLSKFHIHPSKKLGQNFLLSDEAIEKIVNAADLEDTDTVLEIGPGLGVLTQKLGENAGLVLAVEKDRKIYSVLRRMFKNKKNVKIINDDALFFDPQTVIASATKRGNPSEIASTFAKATADRSEGTPRNDTKLNYKLIANIPYYITGKLLQNFLSPSYSPPREGELEGVIVNNGSATSPNSGVPQNSTQFWGGSPSSRGGGAVRPSLMVLLLQKEVAERITAKPGDMSLLSVSVQFFADAEIISYVSKEEFYPKPEVDSAVVRLRVLPRPRLEVDEKKFFQLVKIGFAGKRKQLQNNLRVLPSDPNLRMHPNDPNIRNIRMEDSEHSDRYKQLLSSLGLNPLARAQDLSLEDWHRLYKALIDNQKPAGI